MSNAISSWFHCARCGTLFRSTLGENAHRTCASCGSNPTLGIELTAKSKPAAQPAQIAAAQPATTPSQNGGERKRVRSKSHRPGRNAVLTRFVLAFCLFLILLVVASRFLWNAPESDAIPSPHESADLSELSTDDAELLEKALPLCSATFSGFLAAGTPEQRNQFVLNPLENAARIASFYASNPIAAIDASKLLPAASSVIHLPDRVLIETQWTSRDGMSLDAVFAEQNGEWRLDWEHFIRYSAQSWNLFVSGLGEAEGEFRVLAREPLATERKNSESIAIVLYEPRFGHSADVGRQSPELSTPRAGADGRRLQQAFQLERDGKRVYGATLPRIDPKDLVRLRVKVRREHGPNGYTFHLEKVLACHWYDTSDPSLN